MPKLMGRKRRQSKEFREYSSFRTEGGEGEGREPISPVITGYALLEVSCKQSLFRSS